jgi:hypothetical protein
LTNFIEVKSADQTNMTMQDFVSKLEEEGVDEELMLSRAYSHG